MKLQVQSLKYGNVGKMSATFNNAPVTIANYTEQSGEGVHRGLGRSCQRCDILYYNVL